MKPDQGQNRPWYREPLVWMLILIPLSAVVYGFVTLYVAIITDDGLVVDDYDKRGKEINRVLARDRAAIQYRLRAEITVDAEQSSLTLKFHSARSIRLPENITLHCQHATRKGYDQVISMKRTGRGQYRAYAKPFHPGRWYLHLSAQNWRLLSTMQAPQQKRVRFGYPAQRNG